MVYNTTVCFLNCFLVLHCLSFYKKNKIVSFCGASEVLTKCNWYRDVYRNAFRAVDLKGVNLSVHLCEVLIQMPNDDGLNVNIVNYSVIHGQKGEGRKTLLHN